MDFISTRDKNSTKYTSAQVIKQGLADDGGLFVPTEIPHLTRDEIISFCSLSYPELAATILSKFLSDYTDSLSFTAMQSDFMVSPRFIL